jgi:fatty-acyl-CoA synthase
MRFSRKTIGQMLNEISQEHPERDALIHPERSVRYNYAILSWELDRISRGLIGVGIDAGKRVAIWAPNIPEWLISMLALARIGAVTVPIDPGAKMEDLQFILEQSGCEAIIINGDLEDEQDGRVKTAIKMKEIIPAIRSVLVVARRPIPETLLRLNSRGSRMG